MHETLAKTNETQSPDVGNGRGPASIASFTCTALKCLRILDVRAKRTPIHYDELCRLLYRLAGSGETVECLARAFGLGEDDVTRAVALWKRHLGRRAKAK